MSKIYLVTGATGNVGAQVVRALPQTKETRVAVRNPDVADEHFGDAVDTVHFDFMDSETFVPALEGVTHLFLLRPPAITDVEIFKAIIDCAKQSGVQQIVFLSLQGIEKVSYVPHAKIETAILASGIPYTFLRAGFFMQNLNTTHVEDIRQHDEIFLPAGKSKTAFIDVRDIGAVAAKTMMDSGHDNKIYTLTGNQRLDYYEVADIFSEIPGRKITYANPGVLYFIWRMWCSGHAFSQVMLMAFLYTMTRFGQADEVHSDTEDLLGRTPISLKQYVEDYADHFR